MVTSIDTINDSTTKNNNANVRSNIESVEFCYESIVSEFINIYRRILKSDSRNFREFSLLQQLKPVIVIDVEEAEGDVFDN
jgi:hypothetical protein